MSDTNACIDSLLSSLVEVSLLISAIRRVNPESSKTFSSFVQASFAVCTPLRWWKFDLWTMRMIRPLANLSITGSTTAPAAGSTASQRPSTSNIVCTANFQSGQFSRPIRSSIGGRFDRVCFVAARPGASAPSPPVDISIAKLPKTRGEKLF
uniref:(northern house mosquito) hypothetical protein n=1 Tax=Culex pipiens TaxID=7175 RepID=A0A8D8N3E4_CULPI